MSTSTIHNPNVACCTIPPVKSDYVPKGIYKSYAGFDKVYVAGPENTGDIALVCVFDIFGFKPQTQQGADILAEKLNAQVIMPDFFEPAEPWPVEHFPPKTHQEKAKLQAFFGGPAKPQDAVGRLLTVGKALKSDGAKFVGTFGFCWGGKVTILAGSDAATPFDAVAATHPAMLHAADVNELKVPLGFYPSNDEPVDECKKILEIVATKPFAAKNDHKFYNSFHGFAAARADLDDPENKKQFEDLYARLIRFFGNASGTHVH
ncbi:putative AIM2 family protein C30D10.14 [Grifola frondosa]|uniref:Putative AIM2 family protein C30D10.14 n=1 Tax=Grifola frondosa TaxID=5627 RepID=A0A1C7MS66_GRIFR|nr:putative AIM2 family protein C30D10.14 [Grifola frondosa]